MKVLLVGNYESDGQESMARYASLLHDGLREARFDVTLALPRAALNRAKRPPAGWWKWIGYVDKLVLAPRLIERAARSADIVHVCDHSNAVYVPVASGAPHVVTCHDLLAVRGALGEATDCPATVTGGILQRLILAGLRRAQAVACVSQATLRDASRLLPDYRGELVVTPNALNHPYGVLAREVRRDRLRSISALAEDEPFLLHVGSNLRRKNREIILEALALIGTAWQGKMVFAGQPLSPALRELAQRLGVTDRLVEVEKPGNDLLEALYGSAHALLFPSRFEGFGWPIIEAQASGCPVICSDREPFPEVSGNVAILCDSEDAGAFANAVVELASLPGRREDLVHRGLENAALYGRREMIARFTALYQRVAERE